MVCDADEAYRTNDNVIDGLVITFVDITKQKQTEEANTAARVYAESIVETIRQPLLVLDAELRVVSANRAFYRMFQVLPQAVIGQRFYELQGGQWNDATLRRLLEDILVRQSTLEDFAVDLTFPQVGRKVLRLNARRIERAADLPPLILLAMEDVSERQQQT